MKYAIAFLVAMIANQASAVTTYQLDATAANNTHGGFSILFDDIDSNGLLSGLSEVNDFSGIAFGSSSVADQLLGVPVVAGIASGTGLRWIFGSQLFPNQPGYSGIANFSYSIAAVSAVPVPASGMLLLGGLGLAGLMRRRTRT